MIHVPTSHIFVSASGGASAAGTRNDPATFARAQELLSSAGSKPLIRVLGGLYTLTEPVTWTDAHSSNSAGRFVKVMNEPGEVVELSGGAPITGPWTGPDANGVYSKSFSGVTRELWVNNIRTTRAKKTYTTYAPGWIKTSNGFNVYTVSAPIICTIAYNAGNPCVVTLNGHGFSTGDVTHFTSVGTLPAGITAFNLGSGTRVNYYVRVIDVNTFKIAATYADALADVCVVATNAGSGVHSLCRYTPDTTISTLNRPTDVEVVANTLNLWKMFRVRVGTATTNNLVIRDRDWADSQAQGAGYSLDAWSVFHVENAKEWVKDGQGYWYHDRVANILYYKPRSGEVMGTVKVVAGNAEKIMTFTGQANNKCEMKIVGLTFQETTWLLPDSIGYVTCQCGVHGNINGTVGVDLLQRPGTVECENATIDFGGCYIRRTGSDGLRIKEGCHDTTWHDSDEWDIGGNGISHGVIQSMQTYVSPADNLKNKRLKVHNNSFSYIGVDYWDGAGFFETVCDSTEFDYNELFEVNYSGFASGWYWGYSDISADSANLFVHHNKFMWMCQKTGDGGTIYTIGKHPNGRIEDNYYERKQWAYKQPIYLDNGTMYMTVTRNVSKTNGDGGTQYLQVQHGVPKAMNNTCTGNYYDVGTLGQYDSSNTMTGNIQGIGNAEAQAIKAAAGRR